MKKILLILTLLFTSLTAQAGWHEEDDYLEWIAAYRPGGVLNEADYYSVFPAIQGYSVKRFKPDYHIWIITNVSINNFKRAYSDSKVIANRWGNNPGWPLHKMAVDANYYSYSPQRNADITRWRQAMFDNNYYAIYLTPLPPNEHDNYWDWLVYGDNYY